MDDASLLVQLAAGECLRDSALAVEQGEEDVVRGRLRPPPQDLRYELVPVEETNKTIVVARISGDMVLTSYTITRGQWPYVPATTSNKDNNNFIFEIYDSKVIPRK